MKHITEPVPRLTEVKNDLPNACQEILDVAMAKERENRFGRAVELAQRLNSVARGDTPPPFVPFNSESTQQRKPITEPTQTPKRKTDPNVAPPPYKKTPPPEPVYITEESADVSLTSFKCPNCSAPIEIPPGGSSTKCAYCNVSIIIPKELRLKVEVHTSQRAHPAPAPAEPAPPPPPPLPTYKKPLLGAEAIASVVMLVLACFACATFAVVTASVDMSKLRVASLANTLTTPDPKTSATAPTTANPRTTATTIPTPSGATLILDGSPTFSDPQALGFDGKGNMYVSDGKSLQVFRFDTAGKRLNQWKVESKNNYGARSLASDPFGNVYLVLDNVLLKYNGIPGVLVSRLTDAPYLDVANFPDGSFVASTSRDEVIRFNVNSQVIYRVSKAISSQSNSPETRLRLATDPSGNFYVAGGDTNLIVKYAPDGKFLIKFGTAGTGLGQFNDLSSLVADNRNRVYISDAKGIQIFESDGRYVSMLRTVGAVSNLALNEKGELFGTIDNKIYKFPLNP